MDNPVVTIMEITDQSLMGGAEPNVDLGAGRRNPQALITEVNVNSLISALRKGSRVFLLTWQGNKVPYGAKVLDDEIGWTQDGVVQDAHGHIIGTYDRLVEFGGESGKEQQIVVYTLPPKREENLY